MTIKTVWLLIKKQLNEYLFNFPKEKDNIYIYPIYLIRKISDSIIEEKKIDISLLPKTLLIYYRNAFINVTKKYLKISCKKDIKKKSLINMILKLIFYPIYMVTKIVTYILENM